MASGKPTLLLIGVGELGGRLLDVLARTPNLGWRVVVGSRSPARAERRVNAALFSASYADHFPEIDLVQLDLENGDAAASLIARERPSVVVNTASRSPWWARGLLPEHIRERLERVGAGPGLWAAGHLALCRRLLHALHQAGCAAPVINAAYPDVVHPALQPIAAAPLIGIGNIDLLVPAVRYVVARMFRVSPCSVILFLVAHDFHSSRILAGHALGDRTPLVKVLVNGSDVTGEIDLPALWERIPREAPIPLGPASSGVAVGSLARTVLGVVNDARILTHAPGPDGLAGGYPVEISRQGARIAMPAEFSLERALAVNRAGQQGEGIEEIGTDGRLVLTEVAQEVLQDIFGLSAREIAFDDVETYATELAERFRAVAGRYGIYPSELRSSA